VLAIAQEDHHSAVAVVHDVAAINISRALPLALAKNVTI
jgi:hypothetical protein